MKRTLCAAAAVIALSSAAFLPTSALAQVGLNIVIGNAPPPPRFESVPPARQGYVWAPGYWNWEGDHHVWIGGHWEGARNGQQYRHSEWVQENNGWRLDRGGWVGVGAQGQPVDVDFVRVAPPPPRFERVPHPRHGYIWAAGHWEWRGHRHDWVPGVWIVERPGYFYSPAGWVERDGRWFMQEGRWAPQGGHGERDYRYERERERERERDGMRRRNEHDRDGDGVPNRFDNHPDNPHRD